VAGKKRSALTKEQLAEFRGTLSGKDHFGLDREHAKAHDACKLAHAVPPGVVHPEARYGLEGDVPTGGDSVALEDGWGLNTSDAGDFKKLTPVSTATSL
jgi:hypothetical protein